MTPPLRIAVFVHEFPALSETFVLNQITGLIDRGCDVTVFANARRPDSLEHGDIRRYDLMERTCYLEMAENRARRVVDALSLIGRYRRRAPRWIRRSLDVLRYGREAWSLKLLFWTIRLVERETRYDVVYCHFGPIGRTASFLREIGVLQGALVTAFHGVDVSASLRLSPRLYDHLFAHGEVFLPVSHYWAGRLQAHGCDPDRIAVHRMGVDLDRFRFRQREPAADGAIRLLSVGRLVEKKGIEYALRAVAVAAGQGVRLHYTIVGDGPLRSPLEALAEELGLRDMVTFWGWREQAEVAAEMYRNDVLIAPSVTDRQGDMEGIPVTIMEAMATGMVVVSTRHSGIPELVRHRESGLLVNEAEIDAMAAAIAQLSQNHALRDKMGRAGRAIVAAQFDTGTLNTRLLQLFEGLTHRTAGSENEDMPRVRTA